MNEDRIVAISQFEVGQESVKRRGHDGDVLGPEGPAFFFLFGFDESEKGPEYTVCTLADQIDRNQQRTN